IPHPAIPLPAHPQAGKQQRAWRSSASSVASEEASAGMTHEKEEREEEARWQGGKERVVFSLAGSMGISPPAVTAGVS
ncbi:unnamed protein product, partial [Closterium sp. Naga37s-1]